MNLKIFHNLEVTKHHATAILSLLLALGTLYVANSLSQLRRSRYLVSWMREFLSDFGPTIALTAMTLVALWLQDVDLKKMPAPDSLRPTYPTQKQIADANEEVPPGWENGRPWLVDLAHQDMPRWV
jgi:hypothetical protein